MWKRFTVLVVVTLLPISALAHIKLFYKESYRSDYRKVEVVTLTPEPIVTPELTITPLVEILLESTLTLEPNPTPTPTMVPTEDPTEVSSPTPTVAIVDNEEPSDQITTPSDIVTP